MEESDDPDEAWDGGDWVSSNGTKDTGGRVNTKKVEWIPRGIIATLLISTGSFVIMSCVLRAKEIMNFQIIDKVTVTEKIVYKEKPDPPEPGFDTGNVIVENTWQEGNSRTSNGEYQVETPDGIVSTIRFCGEQTTPLFKIGEKVNIHLVPDGKVDPHDNSSCSKFVRARRWK